MQPVTRVCEFLLCAIVALVCVTACARQPRFGGTIVVTSELPDALWVTISGFERNPPVGYLTSGGGRTGLLDPMPIPDSIRIRQARDADAKAAAYYTVRIPRPPVDLRREDQLLLLLARDRCWVAQWIRASSYTDPVEEARLTSPDGAIDAVVVGRTYPGGRRLLMNHEVQLLLVGAVPNLGTDHPDAKSALSLSDAVRADSTHRVVLRWAGPNELHVAYLSAKKATIHEKNADIGGRRIRLVIDSGSRDMTRLAPIAVPGDSVLVSGTPVCRAGPPSEF